MNALALAKRRAALRRRERGAVMFVVAMTLAVLASVGIYALAAAATEVRTSGNERQNTQTHYLAEYGVLGAAREMAGARGLLTVRAMTSGTYRDTNCVSLQGVPGTAPASALACKRMGSVELGQPWNPATPIVVPYTGTAPYAHGFPPGSFGAVPMNGDFFIELTEPIQLPAPTYSSNADTCFVQLTTTSIGFTQPFVPGENNPTALYGGEGVETQRARLVVGPLTPCPH